MSTKGTIEIPSVLSFNRKLEPSDALMFSGSWCDIENDDEWKEIPVIDRRNRGVKSNFLNEVLEDEAELQKQIEEPNPVWGDDATLLHDHNTLKVSFTLRIIGDIDAPAACNKAPYQARLSEVIREYTEQYAFEELAVRYANNIANARFLWRNRLGADEVSVKVSCSGLDQPIVFDAHDYDLRDVAKHNENISKLANIIAKGLGEQKYTLLTIDGYAKLGTAQRVWPSQKMITSKVKKGEEKKSRHLFTLNDCAAMHSQKIGNALRTIDNWYDEDAHPIAVEPFGSVTHRGVAMRKTMNDFNTLSRRWLVEGDDMTDSEKHFVIAVLIRGGIFGKKDTKGKE
jgi:CRISPR-associated protein Csy3